MRSLRARTLGALCVAVALLPACVGTTDAVTVKVAPITSDASASAGSAPAAAPSASALVANAALELQVGGVAGVPADALAATLNVTVTNPAAAGFVTVWPCGAPRPDASNLNYVAGQNVPNLVIAKLGTGGKVCFYSMVATDLIADVAGFFPATSDYAPITNPTRILDTRNGTGSPATKVGANATLELQVGGVAGVPADALAATLNVTVTNPAAAGFVTVWPCGAPQPRRLQPQLRRRPERPQPRHRQTRHRRQGLLLLHGRHRPHCRCRRLLPRHLRLRPHHQPHPHPRHPQRHRQPRHQSRRQRHARAPSGQGSPACPPTPSPRHST